MKVSWETPATMWVNSALSGVCVSVYSASQVTVLDTRRVLRLVRSGQGGAFNPLCKTRATRPPTPERGASFRFFIFKVKNES